MFFGCLGGRKNAGCKFLAVRTLSTSEEFAIISLTIIFMKLRSIVLGALLLVSVVMVPLVSSAQTDPNTVTTLEAKLRALQAQIEVFKTRGMMPQATIPMMRPVCRPLIQELRLGSTDAVTAGEVSKIQTVLKDEGLFPVATPITGYFGPVTAEAVKKLQLLNKFQTLDNPVVNGATRSILSDKYCNRGMGMIKPLMVNGVPSLVIAKPPTDLGGGQSDNNNGYDTTTLQIVAPNGGEVLERGKTYTIKWATRLDSPADTNKVSLNLRDGRHTEPVLNIATDIPNQGSFEWTVPADLEIGNDYRIPIYATRSSAGNQRLVYDRSDAYFTIAARIE